jgi:CheY-like chemotaxis protein
VLLFLVLSLGLALAFTVHLSIVRPLTSLSNQLHQRVGGKGPKLDLPGGHGPSADAGHGLPEQRLGGRTPLGPPRQILVVEDNPVNQEVAAGLIAAFGHQVDVAWDGLEALEMVEHKDYDMILMDMQMPRLDGLAATRRIRALQGRYLLVPIIAMTANAMESDHQLCLEAGMDDYLSKPFNRRRLKAILDRFEPPTGTDG